MPPPDSEILVWWGGDCLGMAHTFSKWKHPSHPLGYLIQGHGGSHNDVTHWRARPAPPGEEPPLYDQAALDAVRAEERERCARICESVYPEWNPEDGHYERPCFDTPAECAAAIRAATQQEPT
jgi:hypothetical protein